MKNVKQLKMDQEKKVVLNATLNLAKEKKTTLNKCSLKKMSF